MAQSAAERGLAFLQQGAADSAAPLLRQALALTPDHGDSLNLLAIIAIQRTAMEQAEALARHASDSDPATPRYRHNLGNIRREREDFAGAALAYRAALDLAPSMLATRHLLANSLQQCQDLTAALPLYRQVLSVEPDLAQGWNNLGTCLQDFGQPSMAAIMFQRARRVMPLLGNAAYNLGLIHKEEGALAEAAQQFRLALAIDPGDRKAFIELVSARQFLCDWQGAARDQERLLSWVRSGAADVPPFTLISIAATPADQLRCARHFAERGGRGVAPVAHRRDVGDGRIRLGYLSGDFGDHPTSRLLAQTLEQHDRQRFALFGYSIAARPDSPLRQRVVSSFEIFRDLSALTDRQAAELIAADGLDLLVDLSGYVRLSRPRILAARPAPRQISFLGTPGTCGAVWHDALIADKVVAPLENQADFSERLLHLPYCYQPNDNSRPIPNDPGSREDHGLPATGLVFCCFNNSYKITPDLFALWMRLLRAIPGSVLWLLLDHRETAGNLRRAAVAAGVEAARLVFAPRLPSDAHLDRHLHADLFLDTFPCNAHTTASDALWAGLPLLTCRGDTFASRVAASLLQALSLPDLIAESFDAYEQTALALAQNPLRLAALRAQLQSQRLTARLFDGAAFARDIEALFQGLMGQ